MKEELNYIVCQSSSDYEIINNAYDYIEKLEQKNKSLQSQLKAKEEVIKEAREKLKSYITFCENDSQGVHEVCNMAIRKYKNIDEILSKGENK